MTDQSNTDAPEDADDALAAEEAQAAPEFENPVLRAIHDDIAAIRSSDSGSRGADRVLNFADNVALMLSELDGKVRRLDSEASGQKIRQSPYFGRVM